MENPLTSGCCEDRHHPQPIGCFAHALERLYERTGGIDYDEFPALVGRVIDAILYKIDAVAAAGVFFRGDKHAGVTAIPVEGGVAVIEANEVYLGKDMPQLGSEVRVKRGNVTQRVGAVRLKDWLTEDHHDPNLALTTMYVVRTFYGYQDLSARRADALQLLEMVVERLAPSPISLYSQMGIEEPAHLASAPQRDANTESPAFKSLVADAVDALDWLHLQRDDQLYIFSEGQGEEAARAISAFNRFPKQP